MPGKVFIGTSSWLDESLVKCKRFYPRGISSGEERLQYYAAHFPTVEVNASFYHIFPQETFRLWVERTPVDFTFSSKPFTPLAFTAFTASSCQ